jgi:hypothetical protein
VNRHASTINRQSQSRMSTKSRCLGGFAATLLLHTLLINSLLLGAQRSKRPPEQQLGPGANAARSDNATWMTLVMFNLPSYPDSSSDERILSAGVADSDFSIQVASSNPAPQLSPEQFEADEVEEDAAQTAGDPAIQSKLFGSYTAQVEARIRRAWRKPRSAIGPPSKDAEGRIHQKDVFTCSSRITQNREGRVDEVELMQCDGSMEWQMSLVNAIQRASPLPAPPNPTVFTNVLTLSFEANAYQPGYREDDYESRSAEVTRASAVQ